MVKIGLLGYGHLGKIHLKCLRDTPFELVGVHDPKLLESTETFPFKIYESPEALIDDCDACIVASSTRTHFKLAKLILEKNKHLFLEKPMTSTINQAEKLVKIYQEKMDLVGQVGFVERYNPAYKYLQEYIDEPRFMEVHRLSTFSNRGHDVSVVFDLMIHDLDLILSMMKSEVKEIKATGVKLITDTLDICNVRLEFADHSVANITASRMSMKNMRKFRIFQKNAYLSMDLDKKESQIVQLSEEEIPDSVQIPLGGVNKHFIFKSSGTLNGNAITDELNDFYNAIVTKTKAKINLLNAYNTTKLADEIETIALQATLI